VNVSIPLPEPTVATTDRQPVPLLDLKAQYATIRDEVRAAIDRVVESQHFILGPEVEALERDRFAIVPRCLTEGGCRCS